MATQASLDLAQQMYVAYYGRPADPAGQLYWAEQFDASEDLTQALAAFGNSDEFTAGFGSLDNEALVTNLFQQLFGRAPEADGLAFYVAKLDSEESTLASIAKEIADGAQNDDLTTLNNRVAVANTYTTAVETQGATYTEAEIADAQAILAAVDATEASVTAGNTAAEAEVEANVPVTGETFTLTAGTDEFTLTAGDDTVDGTLANSLTATDKILDESATDNDTLNVKLSTADVKATVKNIENVNVDWTSNNTIALDATNMSGNTFNLTASGLAFNGNATIKATGDNNVNAGDDVNTTLTLQNVIDSTVDAGAAKTVVIDKGTVTTVGQKTTADITVNGDVATVTNNAGDQVEVLKLSASKTSVITLDDGAAGTGIGESLEVTGSQAVTVKGIVTGEKITNSLEGAELTVESTDAGATLDLSKVDADLINLAGGLTGGAKAVTVADSQNLGVLTAKGGALTSLVAKAGLTNVTTNLTTDGNIAALDVTGITNLNLDVTKVATIGLTTDADNNVVVTGAGDLTLNSTGVAAIDASALTGKLKYTAGAAATGLIGSSTAKNDVTLSALAANNATVVLGAADDKVTIGTAVTGTVSIDGGAGTDTLVLNATDAISGAKTTITNVEKITAITDVEFTEKQISGTTYELTATSADANLKVDVANTAGATAVTTDLSGLTFGAVVGANFKTVAVTGDDDVVDTIKGSSLNDTIDAGTKGDIIDISQGGSDTIVVNNGDSTYTATADNMDSITGFNMSSTATVADKVDFAAYSKALAVADVDVKAAVSGRTGVEAVTASIDANGILTIGGTDAAKIDTLAEWQDVADLALQGSAGVEEVFTLDVTGTWANNDTIVFDGTTVTADGTSIETNVVDKIVAATFSNWTVEKTDGDTVTFTKKAAGDVTDVEVGAGKDIVVTTAGDGDVAANVTTQGIDTGAVPGQTAAFQFDGNTYLYNYVDGTAGNDNLVELVGVTGATAIGAAGATSIDIA